MTEHGDTKVIELSDEEYDYKYCDRCGIWVLEENFEEHVGSEQCQEEQENREMRERVEDSLTGGRDDER